MPIACKYCIAEKGLRGSEIDSLPQTEEQFWDHLEAVHHLVVTRPGETKEQAQERFLRQHPDARDCPECQAAVAPWARRQAA